jgi:hypothetical protein
MGPDGVYEHADEEGGEHALFRNKLYIRKPILVEVVAGDSARVVTLPIRRIVKSFQRELQFGFDDKVCTIGSSESVTVNFGKACW